MSDEIDSFEQLDSQRAATASPSKAPWVLLALVLAAGGAVAGWLYKRADLARLELKTVATRLDEARRQVIASEGAKVEATERADALEKEKADLVALKNDLFKEVMSRDEEIDRLKGTYTKLAQKMQAEIKRGEIRLSQSGGRVRVDLVDKVLFESGDATISKRGEEVLSRVGEILAAIDDKTIQVSGHTDDSPIAGQLREKYPSNWELSAERATNVARFLQEKTKVNPRRLVASGYGQYQPIATNSNPSGRARNRRIEILLAPLVETKLAAIEAKVKADTGKKAEPQKPPAAKTKPPVPVTSAKKKK